jgi:hypothetical protein
MPPAIRKWLALASGAIAAIALGIPASAHAATTTTVTATSSSLANGCFQDLELQNPSAGLPLDEIDSASTLLYFGGGNPRPLCQKHDQTTGIVEIFTTSTGYCLAYSDADHNVYQHVPAGCTSASPPAYLQWKFIYIPTTLVGGGPYYELQNQYIGKDKIKRCVHAEPNNLYVSTIPCDSTDLLQLYNIVPLP